MTVFIRGRRRSWGLIANFDQIPPSYYENLELFRRQIATQGGDIAVMDTSPTITASAANAVATYTGEVVAKDDARLRISGGTVVPAGTGFPLRDFMSVESATFQDGTRTGQMAAEEFETDGSFEFQTMAQGQVVRIYVDGKRVASDVTMNLTGSLFWIKVDMTPLGSPAMRQIRIEQSYRGTLGPITLESGKILLPPRTAPGLRLVVAGDSISAATGATSVITGYAAQVAKRLGVLDYVPTSFGGTGWIRPFDALSLGYRPALKDRMQDITASGAKVILVAMGLNDEGEAAVGTIENVVASALAQIRAADRDAVIIALSPWNPSEPAAAPASRISVRDQIERACADRYGVFFVDVMDVAYEKLGDGDVTHPSQAGHDTMAPEVAARIIALLGEPAAETFPPVLSSAPQIYGTFLDGETLTGSAGTWLNEPTSYAYQWLLDGSPISGASSQQYAPQVSDLQGSISFRVTATNDDGSEVATSAEQAPLYGANILTNGDFSDGATGWMGLGAGGWALTNGAAVHTAGTQGNLRYNVTLPAGNYRLSFTASAVTSSFAVQNAGVTVTTFSTAGAKSYILTFPATATYFNVFAGSTAVGTLDNFQLRPVL
jgi:lysophospholipase L1-like esterase